MEHTGGACRRVGNARPPTPRDVEEDEMLVKKAPPEVESSHGSQNALEL